MTYDQLLAHLAAGHPDLDGRTWPRPADAFRAHDSDHGWPRTWDPPLDHVHPATTAWAYGGTPIPV